MHVAWDARIKVHIRTDALQQATVPKANRLDFDGLAGGTIKGNLLLHRKILPSNGARWGEKA